jgi:hypothetical protein
VRLARLVMATALAAATTARAEELAPPEAAAAVAPSVPARAAAAPLGSTAAPTTPLATVTGDATGAAGPPPLTAGRRALAIATAVVPGLVLHGAGSWVAERPRAARQLLLAEAIGLGLLAAGGVPLLATYGSPRVAFPAVPVAVTGAGVFLGSWVGDLWASAGGDAWGGQPRAAAARWLQLGTAWSRDPYHGSRALVTAAGGWRWGALGLSPRGQLGVTGREGEGGLELRWHLIGAAPRGQLLERGHRLELRLGAFGRFDRDDDIESVWQEAEVGGRIDLAALTPALRGLFFEAAIGLGLEEARFAPGIWDTGALLLARNGVGLYLGRGRGELAFTYDHRRDDRVGGLFAGRAAGFLGHVGAALDLRVRDATALRVSVEFGTALLTSVALRFEGGP